MKVIDGLFTSKLRYGIQLFGKVRRNETDPTNLDIENIQKVQNKMLRMVTGTKLLDKISTAKLLEETNMMSINQLNAQIKIMEIWKALNIDGYPLKLDKQTAISSKTSTRACTLGKIIEKGKCTLTQKTCINDAVKLWNSLPLNIQNSETLNQMKNNSKEFAKTLPI